MELCSVQKLSQSSNFRPTPQNHTVHSICDYPANTMKIMIRFITITLLVVILILLWYFIDKKIFPIISVQVPILSQVSENYANATAIDIRRIPIGDGRISQKPKVGYVWSCRTHLGGDGIGGAHASGDWIHDDGTYDFTAKPTVDGRVVWPSQFKIKLNNKVRTISGNRLPKDPTGKFPISEDDDAYAYDRNPNNITADNYQFNLPATPQVATEPSCVPLGEIGVMLNGGYFFNALDAKGKDAVAHEIQDLCQGHPEVTGAYHYHSISTCLETSDHGQGHSALLGYGLDGFGIYGHRGENGKMLTNADLDECHGHTHEIEWDGRKVELYHYHGTWEYPYTVGCYRGKSVKPPMKPRVRPFEQS